MIDGCGGALYQAGWGWGRVYGVLARLGGMLPGGQGFDWAWLSVIIWLGLVLPLRLARRWCLL